jgi:hypothetical protein
MKYVKLFESWLNEEESGDQFMTDLNNFTKVTLKEMSDLENTLPILKGLNSEIKKLRSKYTSKHPDYKSKESIEKFESSLGELLKPTKGLEDVTARSIMSGFKRDVDAADRKEEYGKYFVDWLSKDVVAMEGYCIMRSKVAANKNEKFTSIKDIKKEEGDVIYIARQIEKNPLDVSLIDEMVSSLKYRISNNVYQAAEINNKEVSVVKRALSWVF